jgi:hypothetical protein
MSMVEVIFGSGQPSGPAWYGVSVDAASEHAHRLAAQLGTWVNDGTPRGIREIERIYI